MTFIGVDEAGRGPLLGPLVVAAISIPPEDERLLIEAGVDDSKRLSVKKRIQLDEFIRSKTHERGWTFHVEVCTAEMIDITMQTENLNTLECHLFAKAIDNLERADTACSLYLDACDVDEARFARRVCALLRTACESWSVISEHGADESYPVVAAASILAKVARDHAVSEIEADAGFAIGSGYPSDPTTKAALTQLIQGRTPHRALRRSWAPVKNAWSNFNDEEIPSRILPAGCERIGGQSSLP